MLKIKAFNGDKSKQTYMKWFKNLWSGTDESKIISNTHQIKLHDKIYDIKELYFPS